MTTTTTKPEKTAVVILLNGKKISELNRTAARAAVIVAKKSGAKVADKIAFDGTVEINGTINDANKFLKDVTAKYEEIRNMKDAARQRHLAKIGAATAADKAAKTKMVIDMIKAGKNPDEIVAATGLSQKTVRQIIAVYGVVHEH